MLSNRSVGSRKAWRTRKRHAALLAPRETDQKNISQTEADKRRVLDLHKADEFEIALSRFQRSRQ